MRIDGTARLDRPAVIRAFDSCSTLMNGEIRVSPSAGELDVRLAVRGVGRPGARHLVDSVVVDSLVDSSGLLTPLQDLARRSIWRYSTIAL
jgi:hypothetical protein